MKLLQRPRFPALAVLLLAFGTPLTAAELQWTQREGWREAPLAVSAAGRTGFTLLRPEESGLRFTNQIEYSRSEANQNLLNGCGVAAGDFDGDGLCDLYFAAAEGPNGLFRNTGNWRFQNVSATAGVEATNQSTKGVVFADVNGDGRPDLFAASLGGPNALFLNLGGGRFTNVTASAGLTARAGAGAHSAALADVDGDGDLDLYVANYGEVSILRSGGSISIRKVNGRDTVTGRWARRMKLIDGKLIELGDADALYLNDGKGGFTAVPWTGGAFLREDGSPLSADPMDMGLSVMFRDIDGDGSPDIYVCNDFQTPDRIWLNDGKGRFRALPDLALRVTPHFSMGVDFADIDRDGRDDFFVGDMLSPRHKLRMTQLNETNPPPARVGEPWDRQQIRRNVLAWNRGDGTYADIAEFAGVAATDWTWSVVFLDVDLDGYEDLIAVNAHAYDTQDLDQLKKSPATTAGMGQNRQIGSSLKDYPPLITPNYLFRNRGDRTFEETGAAWGFNSTNISHGVALADFDNDGDLDAAVSCLWQPPLLYRNESSAPRVAVRLRGLAGNRSGIGAKIKLLGGAVPMQSQEMQCGGRYLSADDTMRVFAAGAVKGGMTLEVKWRSGKVSVVPGVKANHLYEIDEAHAQPAPASPPSATSNPQFTDVSERLGHTNEPPAFNDLEFQPMLIRSLARNGPGVAWCDLDGDGHDELVVGAASAAGIAVFRNDGQGRLARWTNNASTDAASREPTGFAAWTNGLLTASSGYRGGPGDALLTLAATGGVPASAALRGAFPPEFCGGPVSVADIDGDGDLDIFVGGRVVRGRYPQAASSYIFRNEQDSLTLDTTRSKPFRSEGLVTAAVFSDLDGDGFPELILACEWKPLKIFRNDFATFKPWDAPLERRVPARPDNSVRAEQELGAPPTLSQLHGWWTSVTTADVDGDGLPDIIAGNWGLNHSSAAAAKLPAYLHYGDYDGSGTLDLIEAEKDPDTSHIVPKRDMGFLSLGWPALRVRFPTHAAFSAADMNAVLGDQFATTTFLAAMEFRSMVFLNRTNRFEAVPLPDEAQWSPVFGLSAADFDGDGKEDLFLAQNFFSNRPEEPRADAGRGLLLRGQGDGRFTPVPASQSGIKIHGEQRGSAVADFDGDGRVDFAVAQAGDQTKLFRNETAKPGLRVRLRGPTGNPHGLGASVRLVSGGRPGPARELHGGSGYWSQDSAALVLATPQPPVQITIRWPGGKETTGAVPAGAREIRVDEAGKVEKVR